MIQSPSPIVIRKIGNRRLYIPKSGRYVTLDKVASMIRNGDEIVVYNDKTDEDITHFILTKIIIEQERANETLLPISFLHQVIRWHGDEMTALIQRYLEFSLDALSSDRGQFIRQLSQPYEMTFKFIEEYSRLNMTHFERAVSAFLQLRHRQNAHSDSGLTPPDTAIDSR